jgi:predicted metal-dependent phosphotriesterase family hydrolase
VLDLFEAGLGDRVTVSSSAIGAAVELPAPVHGDFSTVLRDFVPAFRKAGGTDEQVTTLLSTTPRRLLGNALDTRKG